MPNHFEFESILLWICCLCFQRQIRPTENPASLVTYSFGVILCFMWCPRNNLNNSSSFLLKQSLPIKSIQNNTKSGIIFPFYQSLNYNILFYFILSNSFHNFWTINMNKNNPTNLLNFHQFCTLSIAKTALHKTPEDKNIIMQ